MLLETLPEERSLEALDEAFYTGLNTVGNWVSDMSIELGNLMREEPKLARGARAVYRIVAERLGDRYIRRDLAELCTAHPNQSAPAHQNWSPTGSRSR